MSDAAEKTVTCRPTKKCIACGDVKSVNADNFYRHGQMRDGHLNKCIDCCRSERLAYEADRAGDALASRLRTYSKKPGKVAARRIVENAIRTGDITKSGKCQMCGGLPGEHAKRIESHHYDYSNPLDVIWLCTPCHREADRRRKMREDGAYILASSKEGQALYRASIRSSGH